MKKFKGYVIIGVIVVVIVCLINWEYIYNLVNLESRSITEIFAGKTTASKELNKELEEMTVWKFINPKLVAILPGGDVPELPEPIIRPTATPPSDEFDIDDIYDLLKTDPNTAFFWSGTTTDKDGKEWGGADRAREIAEDMGGVTLEMVMEEKGIDPPAWDPNDPVSEKNWKDISRAYAEQASGEVWGVIGQDLRANNIWENLEYVTLLANPEVTKITLIDPWTLEEKVLLERTTPTEETNSEDIRIIPVDLNTFSTNPKARPKDFEETSDDFSVKSQSGKKFPLGASCAADVDKTSLNGKYRTLPAGTVLPEGLAVKADGKDVYPASKHYEGHHTIYPTKEMTFQEFNELYKNLPWSSEVKRK